MTDNGPNTDGSKVEEQIDVVANGGTQDGVVDASAKFGKVLAAPEALLMTGEQVIAKVKSLNLQPGTFIVFGSGPLAVAGIRGVRDIDMVVSESVAAQLEAAGWKRIDKGPNDTPLAHDVFEAHTGQWNFSPHTPTLEQLLEGATIVDGVPFASLEEVRGWKTASGGPKHLKDVAAIDDHFRK